MTSTDGAVAEAAALVDKVWLSNGRTGGDGVVVGVALLDVATRPDFMWRPARTATFLIWP